MQPSSYTLSPSAMKLHEQFQYYADGRLQLMTDLDDRNQDVGYPDTARHFSRAHSYDQAGRLTSASGSPAQTATFPYNQNFGYDAFNNATSHSGTYYYQTQNSDSATFVNNRRQNWNYFADGQVKHSPLAYDANFNETMYRDWTYDAAGSMVQVKETITVPSTVSTYLTSYDGDGQSIREYLQESPTATNTYSVRSTALGGKVLTRLDNSGNKTMTIFEVDGMLTAVQSPSGGFQSLTWTHTDPLGLSTAGDTKSVYDPLGRYVSWQHAPTGPPNVYPPIASSLGGLGPNFGYAINSSCVLDGVPTDCSLALLSLAHGSAEQCPKNYCGASPLFNNQTGQIEERPLQRDPDTGLLGYFASKKEKKEEEKPQKSNPKAVYSEAKFRERLNKMGIDLNQFDPNSRTGDFFTAKANLGTGQAANRETIFIWSDVTTYDSSSLKKRWSPASTGRVIGNTPPGWSGSHYIASDYAASDDIVAVAADRGHGESWSQVWAMQAEPPQTYFGQLGELTNNNLWVVGGADSNEGIWGILAIMNADGTWNKIRTDAYLSDALFLSNDEVLACGHIRSDDVTKRTKVGLILRSTDRGRTWTTLHRFQGASIKAMTVVSPKLIYAIASDGSIIRVSSFE